MSSSNAVAYLNERHGAIPEFLDYIPDIDPDQRINLPNLCSVIGATLSPRTPASPGHDPGFGVSSIDLERAGRESLESGLYVHPRNVDIFREAQHLVVVASEEVPIFLPGVQAKWMGVVFPPSQHRAIVESPQRYLRRVSETARSGSPDVPEFVVQKIIRQRIAQRLDTKIAKLNSLENELIEERAFMERVFRYVRTDWRAHTRAANVDKVRREADERIHDIVDTALINSDLREAAKKSIHRGVASRLYRVGSSKAIAESWQSITTSAGQYANAKRCKVAQSRNACQKLLPVNEDTQPSSN